ncbi:MAG: biopolymer transporter ExbD [Muribaculaceae bacterium]|nr:biopolymer transporter ExbD [Muribaculaceae bacterium]
MSLKRSNRMMATFSMASMTDVIFLLLIFFMVTSTFVFPTALEVNLPKSSEQTALKPAVKIYIDNQEQVYTATGDGLPALIETDHLASWLKLQAVQDEISSVGLYADESVSYGKIIEVLNSGSEAGVKIVLATNPVPTESVKRYIEK